jgi:hypothetical protein
MDIRAFFGMTTPKTQTPPSYTIANLFHELRVADKGLFKKRVQFMMKKYGTSLPCNRFDIGNSIEAAVKDIIVSAGRKVELKTNAKRIDIEVEGLLSISIKYSSGSEIRLHNSLGTNVDMSMTTTLLVTPTEWWILDTAEIARYSIRLDDYLVNHGDSLGLKRSLLTTLKRAAYPYVFAFDLELDQSACEHLPTYQIFYDYVCTVVPE